jgi:hypothetical protein
MVKNIHTKSMVKNLIWDFIKFWMTKVEFYFVKFSVSVPFALSRTRYKNLFIYLFIYLFCLRKGQFRVLSPLNILFFYLVASFPSYSLNPALPHSRSSSNYSKSQEACKCMNITHRQCM